MSYAALRDAVVAQHVRERHERHDDNSRFTIYMQPTDEEEESDSAVDEEQATADELPDDDEPDTHWQRPDVCARCGGRIYPLQRCQRCHPTVQIGSLTRGQILDNDSERKMQARIAGQRTYTSKERCPKCKGVERHVVGDRCTVCVAAAYASGVEYVIVPKVMKPKVPVPLHPIADTNRSAAQARKELTYQATDWPCKVCASTERYTGYNICAECRRHRKPRGTFNNPAIA